ncbi:hypothetical protein N9Y17_00865 [Gammaproteobacteria bacterium]|nr:hypothetical protein [Gammaproteobacteria bacterium]
MINDCYRETQLIDKSNNVIYDNHIKNGSSNIIKDQNTICYPSYIAYILEFIFSQGFVEGAEVIKDADLHVDVGCAIIFPDSCKPIVKLHLTASSNIRFIIYGGDDDLIVFKGKTSELAKIVFIDPSDLSEVFSHLSNRHKLAYLALKYGDVSRQSISERFAFVVGRCPTLPMSVIKSIDCQLYHFILSTFGLDTSPFAESFYKEGSISNVYAATQMTQANPVFKTGDSFDNSNSFFSSHDASIKIIKYESSNQMVHHDDQQLSCV